VYWSQLVLELGEASFGRLDVGNLCPCCGSRPVASVMRSGGDGRQRYLVCSLCSTEWHFVRIKCATCESTEGIEYVHVEQYGEAIKAETCKQCDTYTKLFAPEKDTELDPVADDLASLGLDLALGDTTNFLRASVNLALFPGEDPDAEATRDSARD
jgi:FdhE protein